MAEKDVGLSSWVTIGGIARYFNKEHHVDYDILFKNCHVYSSAIWMGIFGSEGYDLNQPDLVGLDFILQGIYIPGPESFKLAKKIHQVDKFSLLQL